MKVSYWNQSAIDECKREMARRSVAKDETGYARFFLALFVGYWVTVIVSCLFFGVRLIG